MSSPALWSLGLLALIPPDLCPTHVEGGAVTFDGVDDVLVGAPLKLLDPQRHSVVVAYSVRAVTGVHDLYSQCDEAPTVGFAATLAGNGIALIAPADDDAPADRILFPLPALGAEIFECHVYDLGQPNPNDRLRIFRAEGPAEATQALTGLRTGVLGSRVRANDKPFSVGGRADADMAFFAGRVRDLRVLDGILTQAECDEALALWRSTLSPTNFSRAGGVRHHWTFGDLGGDSTEPGSGLIHDAIGANHLRPLGTARPGASARRPLRSSHLREDRAATSAGGVWHKCQLHAHSRRSFDGTHFPEAIAAIYRRNGFDCLALTEHNELSGELWVEGTDQERASYDALLPGRRQTRADGLTRIPPFEESRAFIQATFPGFVLLSGEELTTTSRTSDQIHLNLLGLRSRVLPLATGSSAEVVAANVARARAAGVEVVQVNHPNFRFGLSERDYLRAEIDLLEVWNAHRYGNNGGTSAALSTEAQWDLVNATRRAEGRPLVYGTATDDAHYYFDNLNLPFSPNLPNSGWVMVFAPAGAAEPELLAALRRGDFYATHGARLDEVSWAQGCLRVRAANPAARVDGIAVAPSGVSVEVASGKGTLDICAPRCFSLVRAVVHDPDGGRAWTQHFPVSPSPTAAPWSKKR